MELNGYTDISDSSRLSYAHTQLLLKGYYAATSFVDHQVGKLMNKLKEEQLLDNTIIVLLSDHGFHLGEKNLWCKATNFEEATRVPFIISTPWQKQKGKVATAIVELLDIYPTLAELSNFSIPAELEGKSLKPLLNNTKATGNNVAFSQFPRPWPFKKSPDVMGYSVRTQNFRYTEWKEVSGGEIVNSELYNLRKDPHEMKNISDQLAYGKEIRRLKGLLKPIQHQ